MKPNYIVRVLLALLLVAIGYTLIRTTVINSAPEDGNVGSRVEISFAEGPSTSPQRIVTVVDERGERVLYEFGAEIENAGRLHSIY